MINVKVYKRLRKNMEEWRTCHNAYVIQFGAQNRPPEKTANVKSVLATDFQHMTQAVIFEDEVMPQCTGCVHHDQKVNRIADELVYFLDFEMYFCVFRDHAGPYPIEECDLFATSLHEQYPADRLGKHGKVQQSVYGQRAPCHPGGNIFGWWHRVAQADHDPHKRKQQDQLPRVDVKGAQGATHGVATGNHFPVLNACQRRQEQQKYEPVKKDRVGIKAPGSHSLSINQADGLNWVIALGRYYMPTQINDCRQKV